MGEQKEIKLLSLVITLDDDEIDRIIINKKDKEKALEIIKDLKKEFPETIDDEMIEEELKNKDIFVYEQELEFIAI